MSSQAKREFSFLHTYEASGKYWDAIVSEGLLPDHAGVRVMNSPWGPDESRFNAEAARNSKLYKIVNERKCHFVADRISGGCMYLHYHFDKDLVAEYAELLGDKFLGGQVHEPVSNTGNDLQRLVNAQSECKIKPFKANAQAREFFDWSGSPRWLEYGRVEDYDGCVQPQTMEEFWERVRHNVGLQKQRFGGPITIAEGSAAGELAWSEYYKMGADWCMAEVGPWASCKTQFMVAALRGAAKAAGKKWGVYFAPWGPGGCTCFIDLAMNTWHVSADELANSNWPAGPECGPSTALQRRSFFHAYMSGADLLYEEWGAEDNLLGWSGGGLSSYGLATREFLEFVDKHPDVGRPYTPLALVLDVSQCPPSYFAGARHGITVCRWYDARQIDIDWASVVDGLYNLHIPADREELTYAPSYWPEIFDVVPSDAPDSVLADYEHVEREINWGKISHRLTELMPFERVSDMPMQINRKEDGTWVVAMYNQRGAMRGDVFGIGSTFDMRFKAKDVLRPKFDVNSVDVLYEWGPKTEVYPDGNDICIEIGPGGMVILEINS